MSHEAPPLLESDARTPDSLARALRALRTQPGDAARVERVAHKLGALLDAAPSGSALRPAARGLLSAGALRLVVAALCAGGAVFWLLESGTSPAPVERGESAPQALPSADLPGAAEPATPAGAPARQAAPVHEGAASAASGHSAASVDAHSSTRAQDRQPSQRDLAREAPRTGAAGPAQAASRPTNRPAAGNTGGSERANPAHAEAVAETEPANPARAEPAGPAEPPAPQPAAKSEAALLLEARARMKDEPRDALRLLDEHVRRFPSGMLAPEREVMAIEILRALGQTEAADARLQQFRAKNPGSLHLKRLAPTTR